jgi:hypothetical protein
MHSRRVPPVRAVVRVVVEGWKCGCVRTEIVDEGDDAGAEGAYMLHLLVKMCVLRLNWERVASLRMCWSTTLQVYTDSTWI